MQQMTLERPVRTCLAMFFQLDLFRFEECGPPKIWYARHEDFADGYKHAYVRSGVPAS